MRKGKPALRAARAGGRGMQNAAGQRSAARLDLRTIALRQLPGALVLAFLGWLAWEVMAELDWQRIGATLAAVTPVQWAIGVLFTGLSLRAVGQYDAIAHRVLGTGIGAREAVLGGASAIALAQTLGMGTLTGALARWRLLPRLSLLEATKVSVFVSVSFLAAWGVLAGLALWLVPRPMPWAWVLSPLALAVIAALIALALLQPRWLPVRLPPLRAMVSMLALTILDVLAAGTVLWELLPPEITIAPIPFLAAYLLALGAGLVLTTPGGLGPFEVTLLALLPTLDPEPVLAAVLAYRALYYALPAAIAGVLVLRGALPLALTGRRPARAWIEAAPPPALPVAVETAIEAAPQAEAALLRHGRLGLLTDAGGRPAQMAADTGQCLVLLSDPLAHRFAPQKVLARARAEAATRLLVPVLYKVGPRLAASARASGWAVLAISEEAWLNPARFSLEGAARRQLRRKLRRADSAGVTVRDASGEAHLPTEEMARIAAEWARAHGGERGFSMGIFDPQALAAARVYLAHDPAGKLIAFLTVHANRQEHALDLMRAAPGAADGVMHRLVVEAIGAAARAGVARFSLAAVPLGPQPSDSALLAHLRRMLLGRHGGNGLRQFKSAFAPRWQRRYAAAPGRIGLALGAIDLAREITRPRKAPRTGSGPARRFAPRLSRKSPGS